MNAKIITYYLKEDFYLKLSDFTKSFLEQSHKALGAIVDDYYTYVIHNHIEKVHSKDEYYLDILSLGLYYSNYIDNAKALSLPGYYLLYGLYKIRSNIKFLKKYADFLRGIAGFKLLTSKNPKKFLKELKSVWAVIKWMRATGEFKEEVKRSFMFYNYLKNNSDNKRIIKTIIQTGIDFTNAAELSLGECTGWVDEFLKTKLNDHKWKEDYTFCARKRNEYHLSMFGAEIMNIANKNDFDKTGKKVILLPRCMSYKKELCEAKKVNLDLICVGCTEECNINKYRKQGIKEKYTVRIIPHSSDFTKWLRNWAYNKNIGIIGVACPLNLITGGMELKSLDIPAQCVFLNYCGCKDHWDKEGISTDINNEKLLTILR